MFIKERNLISSVTVVTMLILSLITLRTSKKKNATVKKSAYMIEKVLDEIVLAKARRESDGTYSA